MKPQVHMVLLEGSWRGEAPYTLQVGGDGLGDRAKPFPREIQGEFGRDDTPTMTWDYPVLQQIMKS